MKHYFGTDGIRGIVNEELDINLLVKLGVILSYFKKKKLIIGRDTRISSPMLSYSLISGCLAMGINVYDEDITTTPCIAYLSKQFDAIGVMITASHNPFYYNGIKIFINGDKLTKEQELYIENNINNIFKYPKEIGLYRKSNLKNKYLRYINKINRKYKYRIGIDCSNGSVSSLITKIFKLTTNSLYIFENSPDGYNINNKVGSTFIDNIKEKVLNHGLDIGFSFDGDGDRVLAVTKKGNIVTGNTLIYIFSLYFFNYLGYQNRKVVLTKDTNLGFIKSFKNINVDVILSDIGDSNVRNIMSEHNILIGGENSGHIITPYSKYGDGIITSLLLLNVIELLEINIDEILEKIVIYPSINHNISKFNKEILTNIEVIKCIEQIKTYFDSEGSILIRPSGTENLIRLNMCHKNIDVLKKYEQIILNTLEKVGKTYER